MKLIGVLSDTHSTLDQKALDHLGDCDEIWHAGDVGSEIVLDLLQEICPVKAVYGNIDGTRIRSILPESQVFQTEGKKVLILHIAGYPGKYNTRARKLIAKHRPDIFVCGHSHILKVIYDKVNEHLHINPGAAGNSGFHRLKTLVRFKIDGERIYDMEIVEMKR